MQGAVCGGDMNTISTVSTTSIDRSSITQAGDTFPPQNVSIDLGSALSQTGQALGSINWEVILVAGLVLVGALVLLRK